MERHFTAHRPRLLYDCSYVHPYDTISDIPPYFLYALTLLILTMSISMHAYAHFRRGVECQCIDCIPFHSLPWKTSWNGHQIVNVRLSLTLFVLLCIRCIGCHQFGQPLGGHL